jgi:methyl-accepting chemotaxis protein
MTLKQIAHRGSGALIGLVILAIALSGLAIREISFGGPLQRANQLQSDLVADILPPPEYIIEPFMETTVMVEDQSLPGHVEALATLRKAYEERLASALVV